MPAIQIADRLAELAQVGAYPAGEAVVVDVALLDADLLVLEGEKDFCLGVGLEGRLKGELELAGHAVVPLRTLITGDKPDVARGADLGIEKVGAPGFGRGRLYRSGVRRSTGSRSRLPTPRRGPGRLPNGGEAVTRGVGGLGCGASNACRAPRGDGAFQAVAERLDRGRQRIERGLPAGAALGQVDSRTSRAQAGIERVEPRAQATYGPFERVGSGLRGLLGPGGKRCQEKHDGQPYDYRKGPVHDCLRAHVFALGDGCAQAVAVLGPLARATPRVNAITRSDRAVREAGA